MKKLLPTLIIVILLSACHSGASDSGGESSHIEAMPTSQASPAFTLPTMTPQMEFPELLDTNWLLENIEGREPLAGTQISLQISPQHFAGSAGCNRYGAEYIINSSHSYTISELAINAEGCLEPEGVLEQEEHYTELLLSSTTYELVAGELLLKNAQGKVVLTYQPRPKFAVTPDEIAGKGWQLVAGPDIADDQVSAFTLILEDGKFNGTTVCRAYQGEFQAENDELHVTRLTMTTEYDCNERDSLAEAHYTTHLSNVEQYNVNSGHLELFTRHGEKLIFEVVLAKE